MSGTPRLRSAFPSSPSSEKKNNEDVVLASGAWNLNSTSSSISSNQNFVTPLVPFTVVDPPSQRLYIAFLYLGLMLWRLYDYFNLVSNETDSLWLFMKWVAIDSVFLYGLPALGIPWLQWSPGTTTLVFVGHASLNAILMFRIPIPIESWFIAISKLLYDKELAISETRVKPASILHNSSLILGKQIIHVLPEGSATLNPDQRSFCVGGSRTSAILNIQINQTDPVLIELVRYDLNTHQNETITINKKELNKFKKRATKSLTGTGLSVVRQLDYSVKNTGLYRLQKVVDGSKLEVQRRMSDALVVQCPSASIQFAEQVKCKGDLSDFYLLVQGTAPFKVKYSKTVNQEDRGHVVLSIHSENPMSPLVQQDNMSKRIALTSPVTNISWARPQSIRVSLNESLGIDGVWQYFIDEVYDAFGNSMNYSRVCDSKVKQECRRNSHQEQRFHVHERPKIAIDGYNSQNPLMAPKGKSASLPFRIDLKGSQSFEAHSLTVSYLFTPMTDLLPNQEHSKKATLNKLSLRSSGSIDLSEAGLYTIKSINTKYCTGEVLEPSSCMLVNPPQPSLKISAENISDMCAGSSIGLLVDLEMIGTPPFRISYTIRRTGSSQTVYHDIGRYQDQLKLTPSEAGHYMYEFSTISDDVYKSPRKLIDGKLNLEQDVKPLASAKLLSSSPRSACLEQVVKLDIIFSGVAPWNLEYEVLHNGYRQKYNVGTIHENQYELSTDKLMEGGDYFVILNSISDKSRCKVLLEQEAKIEVSLQKPKASFGHLDGKREISALEGKMTSLPVRLQGTAPWTVEYRNRNEVRDMSNETKTTKVTLFSKNDQIEASVNGIYEIVSINDANCPGVIELSTNKFEVRWIPKPVMTIAKSSFLEYNGEKYIKKDVCEDDEDSIDLFFTGTAPYTVQYNENFISSLGSPSRKHQRRLVSGLNSASFKMDTSKAGQYEYEFSRLGDSLYSQAAREQAFLTIRQHVHSKPSARFTDNGKTYKYCKEDNEDDEIIPINLTGIPPFRLEIEIRHHTAAKLEVVHIPHIEATQYSFHMPHRVLALGTHIVTIRKVEDFQGCHQKLEVDAPHVQVSVADIPSISPLEAHTDYCVGDRISFTLSGVPPFNIFYKFQDLDRKATISTTTFRRIAEKPGEFKIIGISDQRSTDTCKARLEITRIIHEMPSVRVSKGRIASVDLHEGGETEILFEFGGVPPFEFTYTRSTHPLKGKKSEVVETKSEISFDYAKTVRAWAEGIYEVVAIKDKFCAFSTQKMEGKTNMRLLTFQ